MKKEGLNKGITLVALVITVIVLLILAGTAISIAINGGDIFSKSTTAKDEWNEKVAEENQVGQNIIAMLDDYERLNAYGLVGDRFIVKSIPMVSTPAVQLVHGTTFEDGRKGFESGHFEKHEGEIEYNGINNEPLQTNDDVYFCYDTAPLPDEDWYYVYTTSGEFLGYRNNLLL